MYQHYLITRFNLRASNWKVSKSNKMVLTDEWHKNRFQLFTDYCFSSVLSQTNQNFKWLVYFDISTPDKYKSIIESLESQMENFIPIFIDGMDNFLPEIKSYISKSDEKYLITSRLDNDDSISKHYIEEVQKRFDKQDFMALDFIDGYTIQTHPSVKIGKRLDQFNPFITLIEKNKKPKSVWHVRHSHWKRERNVTKIRDIRIWAAIIHQENKINSFVGFDDVNLDDFFENFIIAESEKQNIKEKLIPIAEWKKLSRSNYISSIWNFGFKSFKKSLGVYKFK